MIKKAEHYAQHQQADQAHAGLLSSSFADLAVCYRSSLVKPSNSAGIAEVHPDEERLAYDIPFWNKTPKPAVLTVVPIVAHYEEMPSRHRATHLVPLVFALILEGELHGRYGRRFFQFCQYLMIDFSKFF